MGAEGARIKYPYLSGQWTEQKQYDDTFQTGIFIWYACEDDYTSLFFQPEYILYALAFLFTYLKHERVFIKKKEVMKKC